MLGFHLSVIRTKRKLRELLLRKRARLTRSGFKMPEMESVETVGANSRGSKLSKFTIKRNTCGPDDVTIDIKYDIFMYFTEMV